MGKWTTTVVMVAATLTLGACVSVPRVGGPIGAHNAMPECDYGPRIARAFVDGLVYAGAARVASRDRNLAPMAGGGAFAYSYTQSAADCEQARMAQMREAQNRAAAQAYGEWLRQQQIAAQRAEFERRNRCVARTYSVNGNRVSDTEECIHEGYGVQYVPTRAVRY